MCPGLVHGFPETPKLFVPWYLGPPGSGVPIIIAAVILLLDSREVLAAWAPVPGLWNWLSLLPGLGMKGRGRDRFLIVEVGLLPAALKFLPWSL